VEWLSPWYSIADNAAQVQAMEAELRRELGRGHPLFGVPVRAVARREDRDDVLFTLEDGTGRVAVVHLTWTYSPPERPPWPSTMVFASWEEWAAEGMRADHDEIRE